MQEMKQNGLSRGFFAFGVEGITKSMNLGNLIRTSHAFGASFFFTIDTKLDLNEARTSDTSDAFMHLPYYNFKNVDALMLPQKCALVGVEITDDAIELPSFRHPLRAAYVLGREKGSLSPELLQKCDFVIKIPMKFCVNVGVAGAIVMYDRVISMGRFAPRPVSMGEPNEFLPTHVRGGTIIRSK